VAQLNLICELKLFVVNFVTVQWNGIEAVEKGENMAARQGQSIRNAKW
jgi:hypothetical protein